MHMLRNVAGAPSVSRPRRVMTTRQVAMMQELARKGLSSVAIGRIVGRHPDTVLKYVSGLLCHAKMSEADIATAQRLRREGWSLHEIVLEVGFSRTAEWKKIRHIPKTCVKTKPRHADYHEIVRLRQTFGFTHQTIAERLGLRTTHPVQRALKLHREGRLS